MKKLLNSFLAISVCIIGIFFSQENSYARTSNLPFVDVDKTHPRFQEISELYHQGILTGYLKDNQSFFLDLRKVSRAEAIKIVMMGAEQVMNLSKLNSPDQQNIIDFSDVKDKEWYAGVVRKAVKYKIVSGYLDGTFRPNALITRAEFLRIASIAFDAPIEKAQEKEAWFVPFFTVAKQFGIIRQNQLNPHGIVSRGEAVELIYRFQETIKQKWQIKYNFIGKGKSSFYNEGFAGRKTANGEIYDPFALTAAHLTLPFNTFIKVWRPTNPDKFVIVRINDRGPYHKDRILDLSEKAFSELAETSTGVIDINYKIIIKEKDIATKIPEFLRENFDRGKIVPENIIKTIEASRKPRKVFSRWFKSKQPKSANQKYFPNLTLRYPVQRRIIRNTILPITGVINSHGKHEVKIFLTNRKTQEQKLFIGKVSGKNFLVPVHFSEAGDYFLGILLDRQKRSKVIDIKVRDFEHFPKFSPENITFEDPKLEIKPLHSKQSVAIKWKDGVESIFRVRFSQNAGNVKNLFFERNFNAHQIEIPYKWFADFDEKFPLIITAWRAKSNNRTILGQTSDWKKLSTTNYRLTKGFKELQKESVNFKNFNNYLHAGKEVVLQGEKLKPVKIANEAYITYPDGFVKKQTLKWLDKENFLLSFSLESHGTHLVELVAEDGEILFNRAIYFTPDAILPVKPWKFKKFIGKKQNKNVIKWVNELRAKHFLKPVLMSAKLNLLAKNYANKMARGNFIGHTDLQGKNLSDRLKASGFFGEFGENLAMGGSIEKNLNGLVDSGSHRWNILQAKWRKVGIGISSDRKGHKYLVQIFSD